VAVGGSDAAMRFAALSLPCQVMAKDGSTGQQLISLHVWHANLVRSLARSMPRRPRCGRASSVVVDATAGARLSGWGAVSVAVPACVVTRILMCLHLCARCPGC
jgi:hypothetical protein